MDNFSYTVLQDIDYSDGKLKDFKLKIGGGYSASFASSYSILGYKSMGSLTNSVAGQKNRLCNAIAKTYWRNSRSLERNGHNDGILMYIRLDDVKKNNDSIKNLTQAKDFVEEYIDNLNKTKFFASFKKIGLGAPITPIKELKDTPRTRNLVRKDRTIKLVKRVLVGETPRTFIPNDREKTVLPTNKNTYQILLMWDEKGGREVTTAPHALAHLMAIRYTYYKKYKNIAMTFNTLMSGRAVARIKPFTKLALAHYVKRTYDPYYGLMPSLKDLALPTAEGALVKINKGQWMVNYCLQTQTRRMKVKVSGSGWGATRSYENDKIAKNVSSLVEEGKYNDALKVLEECQVK